MKKNLEKIEYHPKTLFFEFLKTDKVADNSAGVGSVATKFYARLEKYIGTFQKKFRQKLSIKTSTFEFSLWNSWFDTAR